MFDYLKVAYNRNENICYFRQKKISKFQASVKVNTNSGLFKLVVLETIL